MKNEELSTALNEALCSSGYGNSALAVKPVRFLTPSPKRPVNRTLGDHLEYLALGCYVKIRLPGAD